MKIGFLAYSLFVLEKYWDELKYKADCWWGVTQKNTYDELKAKGIKNIVYFPDEYKYFPKREGNKYFSMSPGDAERKVIDKISPDIWISDQTNRLVYAPKKVPWIQTFHSLCFKKHTFHPLTQEYDLLLLPGKYHEQEFIKRLDFAKNDERLKIVGWPRVDDLTDSQYNRDEILSDLGLNPNRKTVILAPTWGGFEKDKSIWGRNLFPRWQGSEIETFDKICKEIKSKKLNFIIKFHHLSFWANSEEMKTIAKNNGALWVTPGISNFQIDPNPFLWVSDILISDMSGIIMDYIGLDRPIIFIDPDENLDAWIDCSIPPDFRAGAIVKTLEELLKAIDDSLLYPEKHIDDRQNVISKIFSFSDGKSAQRAADVIMKFAESKEIL